jgi:hypothetical protein
MADNTERLEKLMGFDVVKRQGITKEIFKEVLGEVQEKRMEEAKTAAREQISKAIELREKMHKVKREFDGQMRKFDKDLGKLLNQLEAGLSGQPTEQPQEDSQEEPQGE